MRKPAFCICENEDTDQLRGNREADQRLCFRYTDSIIPLLLNTKFQASNHFLWLYSPVCVRPGQKPRRPVFSQRGSNYLNFHNSACNKTKLPNVRLQKYELFQHFDREQKSLSTVIIKRNNYGRHLGRLIDHNSTYLQKSLVLRKPVFEVSDQVPHKPGCAGTEDG